MRVIEQMTPCHCEECHGKERLTRMELIADSAEDVEQLTELAARLRSEARAAGRPVTERHINLDLTKPASPDAKARLDAAKNN